MFVNRLPELGDDLAMLPEVERRLEALLERIDAKLLEPIGLGADRLGVHQTLQRRSAPERERASRAVGRRTRIAVAQRRARLDEQRLEDERVGGRIRDGVAVGRPDDRVMAECRTQPRDVMVDGVSGRSGEVGIPQVVDESLDRGGAPAAQCEERKERVPLRPTRAGWASVDGDLKSAEQSDLEPVLRCDHGRTIADAAACVIAASSKGGFRLASVRAAGQQVAWSPRSRLRAIGGSVGARSTRGTSARLRIFIGRCGGWLQS